jgi:hypothetical protein
MRETDQIRRIRNTPHRPGPQPLPRDNPRSSEADIKKMTGQSGPVHGSHTKHVVHTVEGDHRQPNLHSGHANTSKAPEVMAGRPQSFPPSRGNGNGDDAA